MMVRQVQDWTRSRVGGKYRVRDWAFRFVAMEPRSDPINRSPLLIGRRWSKEHKL